MNKLLSIAEATRLIRGGRALALAGSPRALAALPRGTWIAGTTHYFIGPEGGVHTDEQVFVTDLTELGVVTLKLYSADAMAQISPESPDNGFSLVIIPAASTALEHFANRPYASDLFMKPVVGWVAGVDLDAVNPGRATVVDGRTNTAYEDGAVVAHVALPADKLATLSIIDPFEPSDDRVLRFETPGFSATECTVNGQRQALAEFLAGNGYADGKRPLIGNFSGAQVNVSIRSVDLTTGRVQFYAPVFANVDYRLAKPVENFAARFAERIAARKSEHVAFSCNCILNYLHGQMQGKRTADLVGPVTFGEIGYQLLNQTLIVLEIV